MPECLRCGKCCVIIVKEKFRKCPFLKVDGDKTKCAKYNSRIGRVIGPNWKCGFRKYLHWNYEGCPLNEDYPLFTIENWLKVKK